MKNLKRLLFVAFLFTICTSFVPVKQTNKFYLVCITDGCHHRFFVSQVLTGYANGFVLIDHVKRAIESGNLKNVVRCIDYAGQMTVTAPDYQSYEFAREVRSEMLKPSGQFSNTPTILTFVDEY